jgi:hypothetical protein
LWYNGDPNYNYSFGFPGNPNEYFSPGIYSQTHDNFIVPTGQTWTVQGLFARHAIFTSANLTSLTQAEWEIRSGVSSGNPGTLIASGISSVTITNNGVIPSSSYTDYLLEVDGLNVVLGSGTYWMNLRPITSNLSGPFLSYQTRTFGAGAIGNPPGNDGNSFLSFFLFSPVYNFTPLSEIIPDETWDFSMGVRGLQSASIPEPASVAVLSLLAVGAYGIRRRQQANS